MSRRLTRAVFDCDAFYPFRSLVKGPFRDVSDLGSIEKFVRAFVLHDEMFMEAEPFPQEPEEIEPEWTQEEIDAGGRSVIVALAPTIDEYGLFEEWTKPRTVPDIELSEPLLETAAKFSEAKAGNVYYEAHVRYIKRLVLVIREGGSVVADGPVATEALEDRQTLPTRLFKKLDEDWREYASKADSGNLGLLIPPVLGIVLTRCAKREAIPVVLRDLRDEWAEARSKVWSLVDALKSPRTIAEANEIQRELTEASKYFSPAQEAPGISPTRTFWELTKEAAVGASTAGFAGGSIAVAGLIGIVRKFASLISHEDFAWLFRKGGFDLARRVRNETMNIEPDALARILNESEKKALGL